MSLSIQDNPRPAIRGQTPRTASISSTPFTESPLLATPKAQENTLYSQPKPPILSPPQIYSPERPFSLSTLNSRTSISSQAGGLGFHPNGTITSPGSSNSSPYTVASSVYQTASSTSSGSSGPPRGSSMSNPIVSQSTAQTSGYLALFNQFAAQRHLTPDWSTESAGPPHRPTFTAKVTGDAFDDDSQCLLDRIYLIELVTACDAICPSLSKSTNARMGQTQSPADPFNFECPSCSSMNHYDRQTGEITSSDAAMYDTQANMSSFSRKVKPWEAGSTQIRNNELLREDLVLLLEMDPLSSSSAKSRGKFGYGCCK
ncbi:15652_t:CDS:2, partial [Acaulospora colombiana]